MSVTVVYGLYINVTSLPENNKDRFNLAIAILNDAMTFNEVKRQYNESYLSPRKSKLPKHRHHVNFLLARAILLPFFADIGCSEETLGSFDPLLQDYFKRVTVLSSSWVTVKRLPKEWIINNALFIEYTWNDYIMGKPELLSLFGSSTEDQTELKKLGRSQDMDWAYYSLIMNDVNPGF